MRGREIAARTGLAGKEQTAIHGRSKRGAAVRHARQRGYWGRPQQTAAVLRDGWFYTGDQGDVDANGNWRIT